MQRPADFNALDCRPLPAPAEMLAELPATPTQMAMVERSRRIIRDILAGRDRRLLAVVGPCSIHDVAAGREYGRRLARLARELDDRIVLVMRAYFEKPRTGAGWQGLVFDPALDGSADIATGLRLARTFLGEVLDLGLPTATEFLDPVSPSYLADLVCWAAVGARNAESQLQRQVASGLAMPLGFKNGTEGTLAGAINGIAAAAESQAFL
ncbi:MAG: 3-deoxy-7-phosphoheptulonate synthase, partial [Acidobacteriota bacterium]